MTARYKPYPEYKPSGVEWLAKIPESWQMRGLKALGLIKGGAGFPDGEQGLSDEEFPFFKVGDISKADQFGFMRDPEHTVSSVTAIKLRAERFEPNTIVFAKVGAALLLNRFRILGQTSCIDNNMMGVTCDQMLANHVFLRYPCCRDGTSPSRPMNA